MPDSFESLFVLLGLGEDTASVAAAVVKATILVTFVAVSAVFFIWLERKVAGRIQDRLGPTRVGGKFGWLQTIADGIKLLVKEDIIPAAADKMLFRISPYIAFCGAFLAFLVLPFANGWVALNMSIAIFFMLAVMSTEIFGVILSGYGSGSKWSLFGGMREAAQVVSYEVPMAICVVIPVIVAGSMNLNTIANHQSGLFWNWFVFNNPFTFCAFWTYFTCGTASCKRAPFDLAEAESELVAGFHTEYSGLRWSFFFMAEYGAMFAVSGIAVILFLGGWNVGVLPWELTNVLGPIFGNLINLAVFIVKCWLLVFVMMWVRWTLPRLRIDQVMMTCLTYLLPISCALLLGVSLWQVAVPPVVLHNLKYVLGIGSAALLALVFVRLLTTRSVLPPGGVPLPGTQRPYRGWQTTGEQKDSGSSMTIHTIIFWTLAILTGLCAIGVVVTQHIVRAAAWLLFALGGTAGIFFLLGADFIGATQLLVYVGGTLVLVVFGVMLTAQGPFVSMKTGAAEWAIAAVVGILLYTVLAVSTILASWPGALTAREQSMEAVANHPGESRNSVELGKVLLGLPGGPLHGDGTGRTSYLLPFEIVSVHLLVVLIGAAYLARAKRRRGTVA